MNINISLDPSISTERLSKYIRAMTMHVLDGFHDHVASIAIVVTTDHSLPAPRRINCALRVSDARKGEFVVDASGTYPHVAVERALEALWTILRSRRRQDAA